MRRSYLFIYSDFMGSREAITEFLDTRPEIIYWRYDMPNIIYLISHASAEKLCEVVQTFNQKRGRFLISEAHDNKEGWLPRETWNLLNNKYPDPRK